jgi:hypothetical protein
MPEKKIDTMTSAVITRIVGDAAFMFTDPLDDNAHPALEGWEVIGVQLSFSGDVTGEFRFWAPASFSQSVAANMLGLDLSEGIPDGKRKDAVKELVNIIVGNFLTDMFGSGVVATLGLPCLLDQSTLPADYGSSDALWLAIEGDPILCIMRIETAP